jgi:two-component system response regulator HydG
VSPRVLFVDDDRDLCDVVQERLERKGYDVSSCLSAAEALELLESEDFGVAVTDLNMKGMSGIQLCEWIAKNRPDLPVVVITAFGSMETAIAAIRAGAYDFVTKPLEVEELDLTLARALQHRGLREEVKRLRSAATHAGEFRELIGSSSAMQRLRRLLASVCQSDASVLLSGETGTGKELVARSLHEQSPRARGPFVAVSCGAMPGTLLESELFGHVRGAFTDARTPRTGLCRQADGGTLFLDEIGELPLELQPKLLRALQERRIRPVGSDDEIPFDARVMAATNRDLEAAVEEGRFREDLFFRIEVLRIDVPPLRERGTDVLEIGQHLLERFAERCGKRVLGFSTPVAERFLSYSWPGNVRELQNCVERAVTLTAHEKLVVEDLPERIRAYRSDDVLIASRNPSELVSLDVVEQRYIHRVLEATGGNKTLAARILGLDRKTLYRKLGGSGAARSGTPASG